MNSRPIIWAAGLLEGEGCFSIFKRARGNSHQCSIFCEMTDLDVLMSLQEPLGAGNISNRVRQRGIRKQSWCLTVYRKQDVLRICNEVLPYMHERRQTKIKELIELLCEQN